MGGGGGGGGAGGGTEGGGQVGTQTIQTFVKSLDF